MGFYIGLVGAGIKSFVRLKSKIYSDKFLYEKQNIFFLSIQTLLILNLLIKTKY